MRPNSITAVCHRGLVPAVPPRLHSVKSRPPSSFWRRAGRLLLSAISLLALGFCLGEVAQGQAYVNFEGKQTSPIRLSPDGSRLFVVNTPDNRLSVFAVTNSRSPVLIAEIPVGLEPVSVQPLNNDEAWVVNEVSDSVSVVSVARRVVIDTIPVKDEPADVVFAGERAFISAARNNRIVVVDVSTHALMTNLAVFGENPRALTVNSNGTRVYAAFALSGNRTTLIPPAQAPPQPTATMRPGLDAPPQVSLIVDAADPAWTTSPNAPIRYSMPDHDVVEIDPAALAVTRYFPGVGTINFGLALRPNTDELWVANTDARNLVHFEPNLRSNFVSNRVSRIRLTDGQVTAFDLNPGFTYTNLPNLLEKSNALAQPTAVVFGPGGGNFYVAAFGSDRVAQINADSGAVMTRIELAPSAAGSGADPRRKRGPRGLAIKPGQALYVANRISGTISIIDLQSRTVVREIPVGSYDPTPPVIRQGRGFLYDAKLSGNGTVSCASCHIDAEMDLLAWDLGNPQGDIETVTARISGLPVSTDFPMHPMKGPMTTQTLKGLNGLDPLHWRGDRTNFLHFNGAFDSLLGGSTLSDDDMRLYRDFINTVRFSPNPNQNRDRTLPAAFAGANPILGRNLYLNSNYTATLRCNTCHAVPNGTDRSLTPAVALQESQSFKVPQLRSVYQKLRFTNAPGAESLLGFGLIHDGQDPSLFQFLSRPVFGSFANNAAIKQNVAAFVQCFDTGVAPAVGYGRTITVANRGAADVVADWDLLESQADLLNNPHLGTTGQSLTNIDLVVRGTVGGRQRGFLYQPAGRTYQPDTTSQPALSRAALAAALGAGDAITLLGVPPGSGRRVGIDRDLDGVLDSDVASPTLQITVVGGRPVVSWPTNANAFVLERAPAVPSNDWVPETAVRGIVGGNFTVTNAPAGSTVFFRLRGL